MNVRVSPEAKARLARLSEQYELSFSDLVRQALEQKLGEWEARGTIVLQGATGRRG